MLVPDGSACPRGADGDRAVSVFAVCSVPFSVCPDSDGLCLLLPVCSHSPYGIVLAVSLSRVCDGLESVWWSVYVHRLSVVAVTDVEPSEGPVWPAAPQAERETAGSMCNPRSPQPLLWLPAPWTRPSALGLRSAES